LSPQAAIAATSLVGVAMCIKRYYNGGRCVYSPNLTGKFVIVTGANTGIGKVAATELAILGAHVIVACRDEGRGNEAVADIKAQTGNNRVEFMQLDLADLSSVRKFSQEYHNHCNRLDILLNNAGVMESPYSKTKDGFEMQFGTNHLGHFLLTNLLIDLLKNSGNGRVVTVSSGAHLKGHIDFNDLMFDERKYDPKAAYNQSKLANILFASELHHRYSQYGITSVSLRPGVINTDIMRHYTPTQRMLFKLFSPILYFVTKTVWWGAQTSLHCCLAPEILPGYYSDCVLKEPNPEAGDEKVARKLWEVSAKLVKL